MHHRTVPIVPRTFDARVMFPSDDIGRRARGAIMALRLENQLDTASNTEIFPRNIVLKSPGYIRYMPKAVE